MPSPDLPSGIGNFRKIIDENSKIHNYFFLKRNIELFKLHIMKYL